MMDCLAHDWKYFDTYQTLRQCSLVCRQWSQNARPKLYLKIPIYSQDMLLQYAKAINRNDNSNQNLVHTLWVNIARHERTKSCSVIGTILLLISKLCNLQELDIHCDWLNDHHPNMHKLLSNGSVKALTCTFTIFSGSMKSILEFVTHFRSKIGRAHV